VDHDRYPRAIWEPEDQRWICEAEVAEIGFTAFISHPKKRQIPCQLVVRRVQRLNPAAKKGQDELFTMWRHHGFVTNSTPTAIAADETHRDHAIIEQVIAELKDGPLAHAPSGKFTANPAWLALACLSFNLLPAAGAAASARPAKARWSTLRTHLIAVPARIASSAPRLSCTSRPTGPGRRRGKTSGPPPHPDHPGPIGPKEQPPWKSRTDRLLRDPPQPNDPGYFGAVQASEAATVRIDPAQPDHARLGQLLQTRGVQAHPALAGPLRLVASGPVAADAAPLEMRRST